MVVLWKGIRHEIVLFLTFRKLYLIPSVLIGFPCSLLLIRRGGRSKRPAAYFSLYQTAKQWELDCRQYIWLFGDIRVIKNKTGQTWERTKISNKQLYHNVNAVQTLLHRTAVKAYNAYFILKL